MFRHLSCASFSLLALTASPLVSAAAASTPGQPARQNAPIGQFEILGDSIVSAQQLFLGTPNKVYVIDKTEGNPDHPQIGDHPAWASEYDVNSNNGRAMDIVTNSFCAGGNVLGNGTWLNAGGNQAVTYGGQTASSQTGGGPYDDPDGGQSLRLLDPCDDGNCNWSIYGDMTTRRWYPTLETLEDGSIIIIGGDMWGGFVNDAGQTNPTYEFFPSTGGAPIGSPLLDRTLPANLFPLTWLLPSGKLFMQANWGTAILDYKAQQEFQLPDMLHAVRTYPASAGTAMLPLTPANNWTATILFCGGTNLQPDQWKTNWNIAAFPASSSCVNITPDVSQNYNEDDDMLEARSMMNLVYLPDGRLFGVNGAGTGVAGYGNDSWAVGQSYADNAVMTPAIYDPSAPQGKRWSRDGLSASTVPRMYHSSAIILPDGAVMVTGSNPNSDYNVGPDVKFPTEYRVEKFYPSYYNQRRPEPQGLPSTLTYGGAYFNVTVSKDDLFGNTGNANNTKVVIVRGGFSTHAMNMGQRYLQLENSYTINLDGTATLHVSQVPPNPAILAPGPAHLSIITVLFVVVNGVPSIGVQVMIGSGQLGTQKTLAVAPLPAAGSVSAPSQASNPPGSNSQADASDALSLFRSSSSDSFLLPLLTLAVWTLGTFIL
ncbi:hypothetical protein EIP91_011600 [Steccherinum ochraceum]|uniref:Glyoxal oxidase N-terminal domain-containing protein n=1 Tax=Steccherinum ochraceum TaxID=92696 RepID=A0A4R0RPI7_9APHY|nr:hypothetical protein EIP91_011600 [Steccherinum ochraceum]